HGEPLGTRAHAAGLEDQTPHVASTRWLGARAENFAAGDYALGPHLLRATGAPAIAGTVVDSNRDRPPNASGERALKEEPGQAHVLEGNAARLKRRRVGRRCPAGSFAADKLAELPDRRPSKLADCDQLAKLARLHLGLLDVISGLDCGAQDRLRIDL